MISKVFTENKSPQIYSEVGEFIREFVYIDDTIDAFKLIANKGSPGEIYCIGGTERIKVKDLVYKLLDISKSNLQIEFVEKSSNFKEIKEQYIDGKKIFQLGWKPNFTLETGLQECIKFYGAKNV